MLSMLRVLNPSYSTGRAFQMIPVLPAFLRYEYNAYDLASSVGVFGVLMMVHQLIIKNVFCLCYEVVDESQEALSSPRLCSPS